MAMVICKHCGIKDDEKYLFWCPIHGEFHNPGGGTECGKFRKRCDGEWLLSCPVCGFTPCHSCHGRGKELNSDKPCYTCKGPGRQPFKLREIPRTKHDNFKERMFLQAKEFAVKSGIRYMYLYIEKGDYISLKDVRYRNYLISFPLNKAQRKNFYGWLMRFAKGKNRQFKYRWKQLLN